MIYVPNSSGATLLLSANGSTLLTDKDAILERWAEHFNSVLTCLSSANDNAFNRLPQIECNVLLGEFQTVTETRKTIQHLYSGKAPGEDAIPAESNRKTMNTNWSNQKPNPALKAKTGNKYYK